MEFNICTLLFSFYLLRLGLWLLIGHLFLYFDHRLVLQRFMILRRCHAEFDICLLLPSKKYCLHFDLSWLRSPCTITHASKHNSQLHHRWSLYWANRIYYQRDTPPPLHHNCLLFFVSIYQERRKLVVSSDQKLKVHRPFP